MTHPSHAQVARVSVRPGLARVDGAPEIFATLTVEQPVDPKSPQRARRLTFRLSTEQLQSLVQQGQITLTTMVPITADDVSDDIFPGVS